MCKFLEQDLAVSRLKRAEKSKRDLYFVNHPPKEEVRCYGASDSQQEKCDQGSHLPGQVPNERLEQAWLLNAAEHTA